MATTCEVYKNGDGTEGPFTFTFPYLKDADIKVTVDGTLKSITTHYTIVTSPSVGIKFTSGNFPAAGTNNIRIYRDTDVDTAKKVYAAGSAIRAADLNDNQDQLLYALQEEQSHEITTDRLRDKAITSAKLDTNIDIAGTLDVTGATDLDSTLNVDGASTLASLNVTGTAGIDGNLDVNTNKFTVAASSGNTTVAGTLGVTGTTTAAAINASGAVGVDGDFDVNTNKFTVASSSGNTAIAGNLDVDGATTLDGTTVDGVLDVNGSATIDNVQVNGNEIDTTSGGLTLDSASGTTTVDDNLTVSGNLTVNGTTTTVNSTTITIDDPIFTLGGDSAPGSDDNKDRGILGQYYDSSAKKMFFGMDDSNSHRFTYIPVATESTGVISGSVGDCQFGTGYFTAISGATIDGGTFSD